MWEEAMDPTNTAVREQYLLHWTQPKKWQFSYAEPPDVEGEMERRKDEYAYLHKWLWPHEGE